MCYCSFCILFDPEWFSKKQCGLLVREFGMHEYYWVDLLFYNGRRVLSKNRLRWIWFFKRSG